MTKKVVFKSICREISRLYYNAQGFDPEGLWQDKEYACRITVGGMLIVLVTSISLFTLVALRLVTVVVHPWACIVIAIGVAGLVYVSIRQFLYLTRWHIGATSEEVSFVKKWGRIRSRMSRHVVIQRLISEVITAGLATPITTCTSWAATLRTFEEIRRRS